jgi:chromosome segregation ATPase
VEPKAPADVGQKGVVLEYEEAELLSSLEVLIVKGDEARISLGVLSNMPATTKATPEHKTYEENLAKVKVRGQAAATLLDAYQGFAAQVARSSKACGEAGARALRAESELDRLQKRLANVEREVNELKDRVSSLPASMVHLSEWIAFHKQCAHVAHTSKLIGAENKSCSSASSAERLAKMLAESLERCLSVTVAEWDERVGRLKAQLLRIKEEEEEEEGKQRTLSASAQLLMQARRDSLTPAADVC